MKRIFIPSLASLALLGCNSAPVRIVDYEDQPVKHLYTHAISMDEVQIDVRMAVGKAGWNVISGEVPGHLTAIRIDGKGSATVEIAYNLDRYSIKYKESNGLDYQSGCASKTADGSTKTEGRCIKPTYNEWVMELNTAIAQKLQY